MPNIRSVHGRYCVSVRAVGARWSHRNSYGVDFSQRGVRAPLSQGVQISPPLTPPALPTAHARIMRQRKYTRTATISLAARSALLATSIFLCSAPWRVSREIRVKEGMIVLRCTGIKCHGFICDGAIINGLSYIRICVSLAKWYRYSPSKW